MKFRYFIIIIGFAILSSCNQTIEPIKFGYDSCDNCKMKIMDPKFGGVIQTTKGKTFKFDDAHCLISYLETNFKNPEDVKTIKFIDYGFPERLIEKDSTIFIQSSELRSPMSSGIATISDTTYNSSLPVKSGFTTLSWDELKQLRE